jgi:hypothetical protein
VKGLRALLLLTGVGFGLWGVWLMRDFTSEQLVSMVAWLAGGVILHDAIIAPITVLLGVVAARVLPGQTRAVAAIAFLVWATLTVAFINVLSGQGGTPDNDTVLNRPYALSWVVLTVTIVAAAAVVSYRRRRVSHESR